MHERDEWVEVALEDFAGEDEARARRAFDRLKQQFHDQSCRYASSLKGDDQDEAVQEAWVRIWLARRRFKSQGVPAWLSYLKLTVTRCAIDIIKQRLREVPQGDEPSESDRSTLEVLEDALDDPTALAEAIGETWFGYDKAVSQLERNKRVLAVRLRLLHGKSLQEIRSVLRDKEAAITDGKLEMWVKDKPVLRDLSFRLIFHNRHELAAAILGCRRCPFGTEIQALYRMSAKPESAGNPPASWTWPEVACIIERYAYQFLIERVKSRTDMDFTLIAVRCRQRYPFMKCMKVLKGVLKTDSDILGEIDLWKRLAFEYWYQEQIKQKEIMERLEEPAMEGGYRLTAGSLNVWFGNRRLLDQLLKTILTRGK